MAFRPGSGHRREEPIAVVQRGRSECSCSNSGRLRAFGHSLPVAAEQLSKSSRWCSPKRERTLAGGVCFLSDPAIARKGWERHERLFDIYVQKLRKEAVKLLE